MKNLCESRKIKASQILHKIISTHLLTVLTTSDITQLSRHWYKYIDAEDDNNNLLEEEKKIKMGGMMYEY